MKRYLFFLFASLWAVAAQAGDKNPGFLISVHEEGDSVEGDKRVKPIAIRGENHHFRLSPIATQANFKSFWAFPSEDGRSYGAVIWLDSTAKHTLELVGLRDRGKYLAVAVNRVPVDFLWVDGAPKDGRLVIWKGLPMEIFPLMEKMKIKRIGPTPAPGSPPALASAASRPRSSSPSGTEPALSADFPLPEGAVVGPVSSAELHAATADMKLDRGGEPRAARAAARPAAAKPSGKPRSSSGQEPPFQPDPNVEKPDLTPLPR